MLSEIKQERVCKQMQRANKAQNPKVHESKHTATQATQISCIVSKCVAMHNTECLYCTFRRYSKH